jgi:hypothetical protein
MYISKWDDEAKEMVAKMSREEKDRLDAIIAMNTLIMDMNDESAYMTWIYLVPDCANEWDFIDFAVNDEGTEENHLFDEAVMKFKRLWAKYAMEDKGLYIGGKTY